MPKSYYKEDLARDEAYRFPCDCTLEEALEWDECGTCDLVKQCEKCFVRGVPFKMPGTRRPIPSLKYINTHTCGEIKREYGIGTRRLKQILRKYGVDKKIPVSRWRGRKNGSNL